MKMANILFESDINEIYSIINEGQNSFDSIWDSVKEKINNSISKIRSSEEAANFIIQVTQKIKSLPPIIRNKTIKYVIITLIGIYGAVTIKSSLPTEYSKLIPNIETVKSHKFIIPTAASQKLADFLKYEEGSTKEKGEPVLKAYNIGDGMITVGWGHAELEDKSSFKVGHKISKETAENLFKNDLKHAEDGLNRILNAWNEQELKININQDMYDAMVSMIFNMGLKNFRTSDFIQLVKQNKLEDAKEKILTTNVTYPGHEIRRAKESEMFKNGLEKIKTLLNLKEYIRKEVSNILK